VKVNGEAASKILKIKRSEVQEVSCGPSSWRYCSLSELWLDKIEETFFTVGQITERISWPKTKSRGNMLCQCGVSSWPLCGQFRMMLVLKACTATTRCENAARMCQRVVD